MNRKKCVFCKTTSVDKDLGTFYKISTHNFHSNCLMFSSEIRQNADRAKGLNGFGKKTIDYTLDRAKRRTCSLCLKKGATVMCSGDGKTSCKASFHLPCALNSKTTLHQYYHGFETYCHEHNSLECLFDGELITGINVLLDCCKNPLYSHDHCIEKYVLETKAQSKCPWCTNQPKFVNFVENNYTVEIPKEENASFAIEHNSQYAIDLQCTAKICQNGDKEEGRFRHDRPYGPFELLECRYCGSNAVHRICGGIETDYERDCSACHIASDDLPESTKRRKTERPSRNLVIFSRKPVSTKTTR